MAESAGLGNPLRGAGYLLQGFSLIWRPGLRRFVLTPLIMNILLFIGAIVVLVDQFEQWMQQWLGGIPDWLTFIEWLLWPLFALLLVVMVFYGFALLGNLLAAPFLGLLAERVEQQLDRVVTRPFSWRELMALIPRSLARELSKLAYYLPRVLALLVLGFIPLIGLAAPLLWLLFGAWMMSVQYVDYPMDNNGVTFKRMRGYLRRRSLASFGFGGLVSLLTLVPGINLVLMPAAVAGATAMWVREYKPLAQAEGSV